MTYAIAARASFGKKSKYQEMFISLIKEQLSLIGGFSIADLYPSIGLLQIMAKAKVEKVHREVDRVLQDIIDQHKNRKSTDREAVEDLVDVLLKFRKILGVRMVQSSAHAVTDHEFGLGLNTYCNYHRVNMLHH
ncbi:hypothetical protein JHK85_002570 [Glycine max]|nr:hypothetical protein JHK85_002570 [Glycine max]